MTILLHLLRLLLQTTQTIFICPHKTHSSKITFKVSKIKHNHNTAILLTKTRTHRAAETSDAAVLSANIGEDFLQFPHPTQHSSHHLNTHITRYMHSITRIQTILSGIHCLFENTAVT